MDRPLVRGILAGQARARGVFLPKNCHFLTGAWEDVVVPSAFSSSHAPSPELVRLTRNALSHLYDSAYLENHPLAALLETGGKLEHAPRAQRLRRLLLDCIEALRPQSAIGTGAEGSRAYAFLTYRYLDGMAMEEIAARRALSERQAYRELERGLEAVAALLNERIGELGTIVDPLPRVAEGPLADQVQVAQVEVARLRQTVRSEAIAPGEVFHGVLAMLAPILQELGVRCVVESAGSWPLIVADRVMFRQAILNLLTYASHVVAPGRLTMRAVAEEGGMLQITVIADSPPNWESGTSAEVSDNDPVRLGVARALVEAQGGRLATQAGAGRWSARIWCRTAARRTILVVDDNQDLIALFQRFVAGHDITVIGANESTQALHLAAELRPELITVDVMMPSLDGWDVLQRLKATPATASIPVVVCSVLHEPELARGMGASDYLTKPVQQADLLAVLGRHLGRPRLAT